MDAQITTAKPDSIFEAEIICPAYPVNEGSKIYLDEGHNNRHIKGGLGGLVALKSLLTRDGYQVIPIKVQFTPRSLQNIRLLVIPPALNVKNLWPRWYNPIYPAFTHSEVTALRKWVKNGGSLFLIVDHHPFPGAVQELAEEFGFELYNGHAEDTVRYPSYFQRINGTLHNNIITNGRNNHERIDSILTYYGSAIKIPEEASPIITFDDGWVQWVTDTAWNYNNIIPESISGLAQGAFRTFGNGKIVIFGDGNMFSAQVTDWGGKVGFIDPDASYNHQLLLNIIHYLDGLLD